MKIFLTSMLLLKFLLIEASANLDGQTSERVPLLKGDGTATGTTITCSPYSVEDDTNNVEFVKYVLDTEEDSNTTVVWIPQSNITLFEECASFAAEQNVGMFYFDGQTCETSDTVYERKEKTCDSTAAKMVYMQKGFQPVTTNCVEDGTNHNEGDVWATDIEPPCTFGGRKKCVNGVIITERSFLDMRDSNVNYTTDYTSHVEGVDYIHVTDGICFLKPALTTGKADVYDQNDICFSIGSYPCSYTSLNRPSNGTFFTALIKAFLDSPFTNTMTTSELNVGIFKRPGATEFSWGDRIQYPYEFPATTDPLKNCIVFDAADSHTPSGSDCTENKERDICCMLFSLVNNINIRYQF